MEQFSKLISWLFLPMLMPIYALALAGFIPSEPIGAITDNSFFNLPATFKWRILFLFFILTAALPALMIFNLKRMGIIKTIEMDDKSDRNIPIILSSLCCFSLFFMFKVKTETSQMPSFLYSMPIIGGTIIAIVGIITIWWKISLHTLGAGFFVGFICYFFSNNYALDSFGLAQIILIPASFLLAGIIASSRIYLGKHSLSQVVFGFLLGFISMVFGLSIGNDIF